MAWLESHTDLEGHPKLSAFRKRMRWSKNESVGFLHRLWWTVLKYAPDGVISTLSADFIADTLGMEVVQVQTALKELESEDVGFLERKGGKVLVHDWLDYAGTYLKHSKYRRNPDKWVAVCSVYELSPDSIVTVIEQSRVPTNQPIKNNSYKSAADKIRDRQKEKT